MQLSIQSMLDYMDTLLHYWQKQYCMTVPGFDFIIDWRY